MGTSSDLVCNSLHSSAIGKHFLKSVLTVVLLCIVSSIANAQEANEVVVIRGFGGHWMRVDAFEEKLIKQGFKPTVIWAYQRKSYSRKMIDAINEGTRAAPAAIIGFSLGATNAQTMARELGKAGIEVPVLILLDGPTLREIPGNVAVCKHYYRPNALEKVLPTQVVGNRLLSIGGKLQMAQRGMELIPVDERTQVFNVQLTNSGDVKGMPDGHISLPGNEEVQKALVEDITHSFARTARSGTKRASTRVASELESAITR